MDIVLRESERLNTTIRSFLAYARPQRFAIARFDLRRALNDTALLLRNSAEVARAAHHRRRSARPTSCGTRPTKGRSSRSSGTSRPTACAPCRTAAGCGCRPRSTPSRRRGHHGAGRRHRHSARGARRAVPAVPRQLRQGQRPRPGDRPPHRDRLPRRDSGQLASRAPARPCRCACRRGRRSPHEPRTEPAVDQRRRARAPPRILVVDDERSMRELLAIVLRREGYEVLLAENGRAAIETLEREPVDLLISDIKMPDMSGVDVLRAAKQRRSGHPRHHDHGVRVDRDRGRSDAARRLRLPEQAVRRRSAQDEGAREDREPAAAAGERAAEADARAVAPVLEHHRPQRGDARRVQDDRDRRPHQQHDPADRRVGHRQGARRAGDSFPFAAPRQADGVAQLRRDAGDAARVGALRPHARRVHRRRQRTRRGCSRSPRRARSSSTRSAR